MLYYAGSKLIECLHELSLRYRQFTLLVPLHSIMHIQSMILSVLIFIPSGKCDAVTLTYYVKPISPNSNCPDDPRVPCETLTDYQKNNTFGDKYYDLSLIHI